MATNDGSYVSRVELTVNDNGDYKSSVLTFGVNPLQTMVRVIVDRNSEQRATVCGAPPG
jgi:hypothetical protein